MQEKQLQLVNYEQAKKLKSKEIGFDWVCKTHFRKGWNELNGVLFVCDGCPYKNCEECIPAPTVALALKWFRDVKGIANRVCYEYDHFCEISSIKGKLSYFYSNSKQGCIGECFDTYEAAESALLDALLGYCEKEGK